MIKAELIHNPYLLKTKAKFNGQEPRINCQIEKYEDKPLKDWVDKVPAIFHDEMNGYDFDFYFTGTKPDFREVKSAFKDALEVAKLKEDQVRLFHKNEIEDSETKSAEIDMLLEWLKQHPNRKFDYDSFWEKNRELFESGYPFFIIGGNAPEKMEMSISPESVESAKELTNTDLTSTPILFFIEEKGRKQFRSDLVKLLERQDVHQDQLFFMLDPSMNTEQAARVISDLGVLNPQIVNRYDAEEIISYIRNYPITEYIRNVLAVFSDIVEEIEKTLFIENKKSAISNAGIHHKIVKLEKEIEMLKESDEFFVQRDNYVLPPQFSDANQELMNFIFKWKNRKTKYVGDYEAASAAEEYNSYIGRVLVFFYNSIKSGYYSCAQNIGHEFHSAYSKAGINMEYRPEGIQLGEIGIIDIPDLKPDLLKLKEITFEDTKNDFFGLFKMSAEEKSDPVPVVTYYLDQWRSKAAEIITPEADRLIDECRTELLNYYSSMAENYHEHLVELIEVKSKEKEEVAAQLSDDEKMLQEDNDWLAEVKDQLQNIERG